MLSVLLIIVIQCLFCHRREGEQSERGKVLVILHLLFFLLIYVADIRLTALRIK